MSSNQSSCVVANPASLLLFLKDFLKGAQCPICKDNLFMAVGDGKGLSTQARRNPPGCNPLEHVLPNWKYIETSFLHWGEADKCSFIISNRGVLLRSHNDGTTDYLEALGNSGGPMVANVILSDKFPERRPQGFKDGVNVLVVPLRVINSDVRARRRSFSVLCVENQAYDQLVNMSTRYLRVERSSSRYKIFWPSAERVQSFDAFCIDSDQSSAVPDLVSDCVSEVGEGVLSFSYTSNQREEIFNVALGELPLHAPQTVDGDNANHTFVVGPRAWDSLYKYALASREDRAVGVPEVKTSFHVHVLHYGNQSYYVFFFFFNLACSYHISTLSFEQPL